MDLFSGVGGFSLGFELAGFDVVYAVDCWEKVKKTFKKNHPNTEFIHAKVEELNPHDFKDEIDFLIGSPPCQNLSISNPNKVIEKGMKNIHAFLKWVKIIQPKWWIMENVDNAYTYIVERCKDYDLPMVQVLNSANYGVPQVRRRVIVGNYIIPRQTHFKKRHVLDRSILDYTDQKYRKWNSVRDAIKDIMEIKPNQENAKIFNHECYNFNPEKNNPNYVGKWQGLKILDMDEPSPTVTDNHGNSNLLKDPNTGKLRRYTLREVARLQTFPDAFEFKDTSLKRMYKMNGNAVPPLLSFRLALTIKERMEQRRGKIPTLDEWYAIAIA